MQIKTVWINDVNDNGVSVRELQLVEVDEWIKLNDRWIVIKAKESQGQYKEALMSYELAGDFESAILLCLNHLHSPQDAVRIARRSKSTEGAVLIGK